MVIARQGRLQPDIKTFGDLLLITVCQTTSSPDDMDPWISIGVGPWTFGTSE